MSRLPAPFRWLAYAALADWLLGRTLSRSAIFMPKTPLVISAYQALNFLAAFAATLASLLAWIALLWIAWRSWQAFGEVRRRPRRQARYDADGGVGALGEDVGVGLDSGGGRADQRRFLAGAFAASMPLTILALVLLSGYGLIRPLNGWASISNHLLGLLLVSMLMAQGWGRTRQKPKPSTLVPATAIILGILYQLLPAAQPELGLMGPPLSNALFGLGELLFVLTAVAVWWENGRSAPGWAYGVAAGPALAFAALRLANPALAGILAIWSAGLTLYLPGPLYGLGIWLGSVATIAMLKEGRPAAWAILLFASAGFAPQLSTQLFLALIGLWILTTEEDMGASRAGGWAWLILPERIGRLGA
ncbi:MAG TPA: hypothetical protein VJ123_00065 [Anaerolineales bacterium]|nr:hypothetical protein [Anaerolineales bacterium]